MAAQRTQNGPAGAPTMVVIQFRAALTKSELVAAFTPDAAQIAQAPGLGWKFWTFDEASRSFAGVYLFEDAAAADEYLRGPVPQELRRSPHLSDVRAQAYTVLEGLSRATRAPLGVAGAAPVPEVRRR